MKFLVLYRSKKPNVLPSADAGLWSFMTMSWLTSLMWKAFRCGLTKDDLWELHVNNSFLVIFFTLLKDWMNWCGLKEKTWILNFVYL